MTQEAPDTSRTDAMQPTKAKVLIVEDETPLLDLFNVILTNPILGGGYATTTVTSAEEASQAIEHEEFDVVLSDYRLPERDGIEFIKEVQQRHPHTQCLLISGFVDADLTRAALEAGAIACLKKPCSIHHLLGVVATVARRNEASRAGREPAIEPVSSHIAQAIEANLPYTVFIDTSYCIQYANNAFREDYGERLGEKCHEVLAASASICQGCPAVAAVDAKAPKVIHRAGRSPKQTVWEIEEQLKPWIENNNNLCGLTLSFTPIVSLNQSTAKKKKS